MITGKESKRLVELQGRLKVSEDVLEQIKKFSNTLFEIKEGFLSDDAGTRAGLVNAIASIILELESLQNANTKGCKTKSIVVTMDNIKEEIEHEFKVVVLNFYEFETIYSGLERLAIKILGSRRANLQDYNEFLKLLDKLVKLIAKSKSDIKEDVKNMEKEIKELESKQEGNTSSVVIHKKNGAAPDETIDEMIGRVEESLKDEKFREFLKKQAQKDGVDLDEIEKILEQCKKLRGLEKLAKELNIDELFK